MSRLASAVLFLAVLGLSAAAFADTVYLRNGRVITDCTVIEETPTRVVVRVKTGVLTFPRASVDYIEKAQEPVKFIPWKQHVAESKPEPTKAPEKKVAAKGSGGESAGGDLDAVDPELKKKALAAIELMKSGDSGKVSSAKMDLTALGLGIAPVLVDHLKDSSVDVRRSVADVLGGLGAKNSIKALIEALYAGTPSDGRTPVWNRSYMRSVNSALEKNTGRGSGYNPRSSSQQKDVQEWVEWWEKNWPDLPRQIGEPELDKKDAEYKKKLAEAKALKLARYSFPEPESFSKVKEGVTPNK